MSEERAWEDSVRGVAFYNASGETVPPFGVMEVSPDFEGGKSGVFVDDNEFRIRIKKPTSDGAKYPGLIIINGHLPVRNQGYGFASTLGVGMALFSNTDGEPDIGEDIGPKSGEWYLTAKGKGWKVKSYDSGNAYYVSSALRTIFCELDSNMLEIVKVTSTTKDAQGFYPGVVQRYDPIGLTWVTLFTCKVLDANA